jgi:hypothetical protein
MATYDRGPHIVPSVRSVLGQSFTDFELLVIGDGCTDDTESAVQAIASDKIVWRNLARNSGSQSGPNNEGIRLARGKWIAYIGHDDVWSPSHLRRLAASIERHGPDFAVSGCIYYGPAGSDIYFVTGMFDDAEAPFRHFFPPSSIAHRREVVDAIGGWREPDAIARPVDADFQLRAAEAGLRFASTGAITVHKFAAGHRYLSYLRQDSSEQAHIIDLLREGEAEWTARVLAASKRSGHFMSLRHEACPAGREGVAYEQNRKNKGLSRPPLRPLVRRQTIRQADDPRGLDWHSPDSPGSSHRWSGPSPAARILIPFTGGEVLVSIEIVATPPGWTPEDLSISVNGQDAPFLVRAGDEAAVLVQFEARLRECDYTVVTMTTLRMFRPSELLGVNDDRKLGIAVGDVVVERPDEPQGPPAGGAPGAARRRSAR